MPEINLSNQAGRDAVVNMENVGIPLQVRWLDTKGRQARNVRLLKSLVAGTIYKFDYSYRGGLEWDAGFLMMNQSQEIYFLVGGLTQLKFVGLQQAAAAVETPDNDTTADDLMDFGMI